MQLLKKCCSLLLSVLLLSGLALTAFADIETTVSGDSVSIRFDFGAKYADMEFGYEILNPGAELCDVQSEMPETVLDTFAELSQATTDGTGKATVTFSPPAKSGVYTIYAGRTVKKLQGDFEFISKNEVKNLLIQLSGLSAGGTSVVAAMFGEAEEGTIAAYE
ncbi:MAG: hypothetical protein IKL80_00720, partial [Clostridia bacterium]|nr:hypothetical protein [Clostridia bacterium]